MLLLSADTSGLHGSIALAQCEMDGSCTVLEIVPLEGGTFSAQLVPQIAALLGKHGFNKRDLGAFAIASGPGSFTGLRVGLAAIKALAEVLHKPVAAVSLLQAVAGTSRRKGRVLAALDAGRDEIYTGDYENNSTVSMLRESLLTRKEFLAAAIGLSIVTPDVNIAQLAGNAGLLVESVERPRSDVLAGLGWNKILAGETVSPETLEANYIRRSDAEIFSRPPA